MREVGIQRRGTCALAKDYEFAPSTVYEDSKRLLLTPELLGLKMTLV